MRFDWKRLVLILGLGACAIGCADFHRGPALRDAGQDASADNAPVADLTFETAVYPILQLRCQDCHRAGGEAEDTHLVLTGNARSDRAMVLALVAPGDPANSLLLRRATGESHDGGEVLAQDSSDYQTIASWIMGLPSPP